MNTMECTVTLLNVRIPALILAIYAIVVSVLLDKCQRQNNVTDAHDTMENDDER